MMVLLRTKIDTAKNLGNS